MRLLLLRLRHFEERVIKRQRERDLEMSLTLDGLITKQQKTNFIQMNPHRSNKRKNPIVHREFQRHILNQECKVMTMSYWITQKRAQYRNGSIEVEALSMLWHRV